ncbi:3546_t:CDS:2, partial [Gigaspora margarita]
MVFVGDFKINNDADATKFDDLIKSEPDYHEFKTHERTNLPTDYLTFYKDKKMEQISQGIDDSKKKEVDYITYANDVYASAAT